MTSMALSACRRHHWILAWFGDWSKGVVRLRCARCRIWWDDR